MRLENSGRSRKNQYSGYYHCGQTADSYFSDLTSFMEKCGYRPSRLVSRHQNGWRISLVLLMSEITTGSPSLITFLLANGQWCQKRISVPRGVFLNFLEAQEKSTSEVLSLKKKLFIRSVVASTLQFCSQKEWLHSILSSTITYLEATPKPKVHQPENQR